MQVAPKIQSQVGCISRANSSRNLCRPKLQWYNAWTVWLYAQKSNKKRMTYILWINSVERPAGLCSTATEIALTDCSLHPWILAHYALMHARAQPWIICSRVADAWSPWSKHPNGRQAAQDGGSGEPESAFRDLDSLEFMVVTDPSS